VTAAACSVALGNLDAPARDRIEALIDALGLPCRIPASLSSNEIWQAMLSDKKMQGGRPKLILVRELGRAEIVGDYDIDTILNEVDALRVDHAPAELVA
jgi:3-dehydroquinate synthase